MKYATKRVFIHAEQWTGDRSAIANLVLRHGNSDTSVEWDDNGELFVNTLEGRMHATLGDFVIAGLGGELYPCKPDKFWPKYEVAQ